LELSTEKIEPNSLISKGCQEYQGSSFIVTGRGGLPSDPTQLLESLQPWQDWRFFSQDLSSLWQSLPLTDAREPGNIPANIPANILRNKIANQSVVEATGWMMNDQGKIELVNHLAEGTNLYYAPQCSNLFH
jgi:large exoprotein involved in heme utilization and adhesion